MDFGRLPSVEGIAFDLPAIDPRSVELLAAGAAASPRAVRIGAPAWASRDFAKKLYPKGTRPGDYLARYGELFFSVELNATFHRVPDASTVDGWRDAVPEAFRFCPKLHRHITDDLDVEGARRFASLMTRFGARLGPMLLQLGPSFGPKRLGDLERFLDALTGHAVAVELRSRGWFERGRLREDLFRALAARGVTAVITDTAGRRDVCHGSLTSRVAFVRFQGNELHPTDAQRLDGWAARFAAWIEQGVEQIYFFVHQPDDTLGPETLALLAERARRATGLDAVPPAQVGLPLG